jgi:phosphoglycerate kinase
LYKPDLSLIEKASYRNADLAGKTVLMRAGLNVAIENGKITEGYRLKRSVQSIKQISELAAKVIIVAHLGRPEGYDESLSLRQLLPALNAELGQPVEFVGNIEEAKTATSKIVLLENIRFLTGEDSEVESERMELAKQLAGLADVFVNDAFADYHKSASTYELAKQLPSYLGPQFVKELTTLSKIDQLERPLVVVFGGKKLSDKLDALVGIVPIADKVLVGGAMAFTLLKAEGIEVGKSLVEEDKIEEAKQLLLRYPDKIVIPIDHVTIKEFKEPQDGDIITTETNLVPVDRLAADIGPKTRELFKQEIAQAKSVIWNGPMGIFEWDSTAMGTQEIGKSIAESNSYSIAGGGETLAAISKFELNGIEYISTGGGALLKLLSDDDFPVVDVITSK